MQAEDGRQAHAGDVVNLDEYRLTIAKNMSEATLQTKCEMAAKELGWIAYHTYDSRRSPAGFPDLVMIHPPSGYLVVRELKSMKGTTTKDQDMWLAGFAAAGVDTGVWRPIDYVNETVIRTLTQTRRNP